MVSPQGVHSESSGWGEANVGSASRALVLGGACDALTIIQSRSRYYLEGQAMFGAGGDNTPYEILFERDRRYIEQAIDIISPPEDAMQRFYYNLAAGNSVDWAARPPDVAPAEFIEQIAATTLEVLDAALEKPEAASDPQGDFPSSSLPIAKQFLRGMRQYYADPSEANRETPEKLAALHALEQERHRIDDVDRRIIEAAADTLSHKYPLTYREWYSYETQFLGWGFSINEMVTFMDTIGLVVEEVTEPESSNPDATRIMWQLIGAINERRDAARKIARIKPELGIAVNDPGREVSMMAKRLQWGEDLGLTADVVETVIGILIVNSKREQLEMQKIMQEQDDTVDR